MHTTECPLLRRFPDLCRCAVFHQARLTKSLLARIRAIRPYLPLASRRISLPWLAALRIPTTPRWIRTGRSCPWLSPRQRWFTPLRSLVTLPLIFESGLIEKRARAHSLHKSIDDEYATVLLKHTLKNARAMLASVTPRAHVSRWSRDAATATHYDMESHSAKQSFVSRILTSIRPAKVLDVGANTGVYSRIAAEAGADVVAWDTDVQAADLNWETAMQNRLPILPVVADFARPTPSVGWNNAECASLLSRARGRFDCVLMLGVLHHLLVADQVPLAAILRQLAGISRRWAILEWIPREDTQFSSLCRGIEQLYAHLTEPYFVQKLSEQFKIRSHESLPNGRTLWFVEKAA